MSGWEGHVGSIYPLLCTDLGQPTWYLSTGPRPRTGHLLISNDLLSQTVLNQLMGNNLLHTKFNWVPFYNFFPCFYPSLDQRVQASICWMNQWDILLVMCWSGLSNMTEALGEIWVDNPSECSLAMFRASTCEGRGHLVSPVLSPLNNTDFLPQPGAVQS